VNQGAEGRGEERQGKRAFMLKEGTRGGFLGLRSRGNVSEHPREGLTKRVLGKERIVGK